MNIKFNNKKGLPGGPNEISSKGSVSVEGYKIGSPDFNNDFNIIESNNITMEDVPFPVMGTDNLGNQEIMMPGANYTFPGDSVFEIPLAQIGGTVDSAYKQHPFEKFAKSQGMSVEEALQIVLSNAQSYPPEIINAARDYELEIQKRNPVNDKQDESAYSTKEQQELPKAQDGDETDTKNSSGLLSRILNWKETLVDNLNPAYYSTDEDAHERIYNAVVKDDSEYQVHFFNQINEDYPKYKETGKLTERLRSLFNEMGYYEEPYKDSEEYKNIRAEFENTHNKLLGNPVYNTYNNNLPKRTVDDLEYIKEEKREQYLNNPSWYNIHDLNEEGRKLYDEAQEKVNKANEKSYQSRYLNEEGIENMLSDHNQRKDLFRLSIGLPQEHNSISKSKYKPTKSTNSDSEYYTSPNTDSDIKYIFEDYFKFKQENSPDYFANDGRLISKPETYSKPEDEINSLRSFIHDKYGRRNDKLRSTNRVHMGQDLGEFILDAGKDEKGHYISYYDVWDVNPFGSAAVENYNSKDYNIPINITDALQKFTNTEGIEIYNRIYYNPKTGEILSKVKERPELQYGIRRTGGSLIKAQNGRESKKEKEARLEQERLEAIENQKKLNKQIAEDFSTDPVEINTEGLRNPLRVYPNPITSNFMTNNPIPTQDTDINYVESMVDYYAGLNDPNSLISQRISGDFSNDTRFGEYSATLPVQEGLSNYDIHNYDFEDGKMIKTIDPKRQSAFENLQVTPETVFNAVYPRLTNFTFLDATNKEKIGIESMKEVDEKREQWIKDGNNPEDFDMFAGLNIYEAKALLSKAENVVGPHAKSLINPYYDELIQGENYEKNKRKLLIEAGEDPNDPRFENLMGALVMPEDITNWLETSNNPDVTKEQLLQDWKDTLAHELGHITGRDDFMSERDNKIYKDLNYAHTYEDEMDEGMKEAQSTFDGHLAKRTTHEASADLNAVRLDMLERGIYDYRNEQMTKEHWDEYLKSYDPDMKTTNENYPLSLQRILYRYRLDLEENPYRSKLIADPENTGDDQDSNIRFINNSVADANEIGDDIDVATVKYGAELPSYQDNGAFDVESDYIPEPPGGYKKVSQPRDNISRRGEMITVGNREYPISGYGEGDVPYITADYGSPEHRHLYNTTNLLDEVELVDNDPVREYTDYLENKHGNTTDWMGIPYDRSNKNTAYLRRQELTNPVFNAVVDPLYGNTKGLQAIDTASELGFNAIPYLMTGAVLPGSQTRLGQLGYRGFQGLMNTKLPVLGTVGQGLNLYGGVYGAANAPGHVKELIDDGPSLRTVGNLGLDAFGMGIGGFQAAKYFNQAKGSLPNFIKPFNYGNKTLKIDKPQIIAPAGTTGPSSPLTNVDEMIYGKYPSYQGQQVVDDYIARIQTEEGQRRLTSMLNEKFVGPNRLWDKIPTSGPQLTAYNKLINNTLRDFTTGSKNLKLLNYPNNKSVGAFDYNKLGAPRVYMNSNIPVNSLGVRPTVSHELGHNTQSLIRKHLRANLGFLNPSNVNPYSRQRLINNINKVGNTEIDTYLGKNFKLKDPEWYPSTPSGPLNAIDEANLTPGQLDDYLTDIYRQMGTDKSYNYFARGLDRVKNAKTKEFERQISTTNPLGTSREPLGYLSELRQGMLDAGYLKDPYQLIKGSDITNYYKNFINSPTFNYSTQRQFIPRLLKMGDLGKDNLNMLASQMNKLPAYIGAAGTAGALSEDQPTGTEYQPGGETYGPVTMENSYIDDDADGLPVGVDRDDSIEVDNDILLLQAMAESALNPNAVSNKGAKGLTQIMPDALTDYTKATGNKDIDLTNYKDAMSVQKWYMNNIYNRDWINKQNQSPNVRLAKTLAAYNYGPTRFNNFLNKQKNNNVDIYGDDMTWINDLNKETKEYVNKILLRNDSVFEKKVNTLQNDPKLQVYINAYKKKGGSVKKYNRLFKDYKKHKAGEDISPTVLKELYKLGLTNKTKNKLDLKNIKFNFEYNLNNAYKKGGQLNLNLNQQIKFYEDYVKGSFDGGAKETKANQIFKKLNKMYYLPTKKTGGNVLGYLHAISKNIS